MDIHKASIDGKTRLGIHQAPTAKEIATWTYTRRPLKKHLDCAYTKRPSQSNFRAYTKRPLKKAALGIHKPPNVV